MVDVFNKQKIVKLEQQIRKYKDKCLQLMDENKDLKEALEATKIFNNDLILIIENHLDNERKMLEEQIKQQQYIIPNDTELKIVHGVPWWKVLKIK